MAVEINNKISTHGSAVDFSAKANAKEPTFKGQPYVIQSGSFDRFLSKIPDTISSSEQRLIMGVTALFTQPFIDLNNKRVDEETRLMSFARTLSKIVIGTTVGVLVRKGSIALANKYTDLAIIPKKIAPKKSDDCWAAPAPSHSFLSPSYIRTYSKAHHQNYVNTLGTLLGVFVSLFTNFIIDAPLTQIMTNRVYSNIKPKSDKPEGAVNLLEQYVGSNQSELNKPEEDKSGTNNTVVSGKDEAQNAKTVSFGGDVKKTIIKVAPFAKYVPQEGVEPKFYDHRAVKRWIWTRIASKPGSMLMHTGALGWAASSGAQITGMAFNDKIDSEKKKFLIPQEAADAAGNIALYYLLTLFMKNHVEKLFETGKIRVQSVVDAFRAEMKDKPVHERVSEDKIFHVEKLNDKKQGILANLEGVAPKTKEVFLRYKNGASILATIVASIISCNILTPYFRNFYAAHCQEKLMKHHSKVNAALFDMERKNIGKAVAKKPKAFDKFNV